MPNTEIQRMIDAAGDRVAQKFRDEILALDTLPVRQRWLDCDQASSYSRLSKAHLATLRSQARKGLAVTPEYRKLGARIVYRVDQLDEYIEAHPRQPTAA